MSWTALEDIAAYCRENNCSFWKAVQDEDVHDRQVTAYQSWNQMKKTWEAMKEASESYDASQKSRSGLVGGSGAKMQEYVEAGQALTGEFTGEVIAEALKTSEANACMKRIVAAPTAGSCGVLPAVLIPYSRRMQRDEEEILKALYVAAGIGQVIAERAFIAGASGGCQAEIGSASAMAAGALVYLKGGSPEEIGSSVAMALKNMLGLVCDPVAGLVEVPCVKRNAAGAVNALTSADMALAGIESRIPADEVIDAMKEVGMKMDDAFKETARGGVAASKTGKEIAERVSK